MCGIIGYIGPGDVMSIVLDGLERLAYRGYDSAGLALVTGDGLFVERSAGKIAALKDRVAGKKVKASLGIGHTRWATHGRPNEENAHPHSSERFVVVHNGIIENYLALRHGLEKKGYQFQSETDTEVIVHLIHSFYEDDFPVAVRRATAELKGSYALAVISGDHPDTLLAVREQSPMVVGLSRGEYFVASDIPAFLQHTREVIVLENGQMAEVTPEGVAVRDRDMGEVRAETIAVTWNAVTAEKGGYKHYMLKEIFEQDQAVLDTFRGRIDLEKPAVYLEDAALSRKEARSLERVILVACGTSYHAGLVAEYFLEDLCRLPVEVEIASEFRYRSPIVGEKTLVVAISQSGETADTLAAVREARSRGGRILAICNVVGSSLARDSEGVVYTHAGPEIGVASTKAFTSQITALYLLALYLGSSRGSIKKERLSAALTALTALPRKMKRILEESGLLEELAREFYLKEDFLYLGRGISFPVALEGALKLKEISYIHAEGYAGGEMKHGPIALIDEEMPVMAAVPRDETREKILSNIQEVRARDGIVIGVGPEGDKELEELCHRIIPVPETDRHLNPILMTIPMQLFAYYIADRRGTDVDQPRNLAKSVTVE
jgi:glucosamine--fructose-6-phosphate aminotransferase (isomerizing)